MLYKTVEIKKLSDMYIIIIFFYAITFNPVEIAI